MTVLLFLKTKLNACSYFRYIAFLKLTELSVCGLFPALVVFSKLTKVHLLKTLLLNYHTHSPYVRTMLITVQMPLVPNRTAENEGFGFSDAQSVSWYMLLFPVLSKNVSAAKGESEHVLF